MESSSSMNKREVRKKRSRVATAVARCGRSWISAFVEAESLAHDEVNSVEARRDAVNQFSRSEVRA